MLCTASFTKNTCNHPIICYNKARKHRCCNISAFREPLSGQPSSVLVKNNRYHCEGGRLFFMLLIAKRNAKAYTRYGECDYGHKVIYVHRRTSFPGGQHKRLRRGRANRSVYLPLQIHAFIIPYLRLSAK